MGTERSTIPNFFNKLIWKRRRRGGGYLQQRGRTELTESLKKLRGKKRKGVYLLVSALVL